MGIPWSKAVVSPQTTILGKALKAGNARSYLEYVPNPSQSEELSLLGERGLVLSTCPHLEAVLVSLRNGVTLRDQHWIKLLAVWTITSASSYSSLCQWEHKLMGPHTGPNTAKVIFAPMKPS